MNTNEMYYRILKSLKFLEEKGGKSAFFNSEQVAELVGLSPSVVEDCLIALRDEGLVNARRILRGCLATLTAMGRIRLREIEEMSESMSDKGKLGFRTPSYKEK